MSGLRPYVGPDATLQSRTRVVADVLVAVVVAVGLWLLVRVAHGINAPFDPAHAATEVSTDPATLPYAALRSLVRMFAALGLSVGFTFVYATAATRSRRAGKVLVPLLDILQSVPVLGFLSVTLTMWLTLFPNTMLGLECASIFAIFTSQVWNLTFAFYESLSTQPRELDEAARVLRMTKWQRFWKLDVPSGMIPLVWNGMMSFGGGWFFLVASEVISVNNHTYALPGIGSYAAAAAQRSEVGHLLLAIGVMVLVIIAVNVAFWRPMVAWAERFRSGDTSAAVSQRSLVLDLLRHSAVPGLLSRIFAPVGRFLDRVTRVFGLAERHLEVNATRRRAGDAVFTTVLVVVVVGGLARMLSFVDETTGLGAFAHAAALGAATFARVVALLILATLLWVPVGVWIGMNPRVTRFAQPVVQILASFPANFLFPLATLVLVKTGLSIDIGGVLLMALGAQWYILFNVIAGASAIPNDLREASASLGLSRALRWRTLIGPAIFSSWVTGGITAAGGAWNASIVAEVVSYGDHRLVAHGLGAYITEATAHGRFGEVLVGVLVMSAFVVTTNRLFWRPLYRLSERRYSLS